MPERVVADLVTVVGQCGDGVVVAGQRGVLADHEERDAQRALAQHVEHQGNEDVEVAVVRVPAGVAVGHLVRPEVVDLYVIMPMRI